MARKTVMNSITSPELLAQVNPENIQLMNDFLDYKRSVKMSEGTIAGYKNDIEIAFVWCLKYNGNKFFVDWTKRNIVAYQNWLIGNNENSPARVRRLKASLSSLSNFIENILDSEFPNFRNIINKVENPANMPVREKTVLSDEDIDGLLNRLSEAGEREKACLLALGAYSGRRKSELCRFRVSDFDDKNLVCNGALYKSGLIKTKGRGGGKYINCYTLAKKFKPYLEAWMNERKEIGIESEWLFPNRMDTSTHIGVPTINSWATTFGNMLGVPFYTHALRHYFTTFMVRSGIPDGVIAEIVNWESVDMCKVYTDLDAEDQIAMYFDDSGDIKSGAAKSMRDL